MIHPNVSFFSGQYWRHTLISAAVLAALICTVAGAFGQPRIPMRPQKATIIVDSADKTKIRGFTSIAMVWGKQVKQPYKDITSSVINLATAMNNWTEVYTTGFNNMTLSSDVLLDVPFCIMTTEEEFELTMPELSNVRKYLQSGGFIFCDNAIGTVHSSPIQK